MTSDVNYNEENGQKLVRLINAGFSNKTKDIYEYDIGIFDESQASAFYLVEQDHYLLLNKKSMKEFYFYWRTKYFSVGKSKEFESYNFDETTKCILLVNPNFLSAWSRRKEMLSQLISGQNETDKAFFVEFEDELEFNRLILKKNFKCEPAFMHRRWLIKLLVLYLAPRSENFTIEKILRNEVNFIVNDLSKKIKSNYYCWSYLNYLLEFYQKDALTNSAFVSVYSNLLNQELETLLFLNPSDFSVLHTRLNLIKLILKLIKSPKNFLTAQLKLNEELLIRYPQISSVWNYCKYFFLILKSSDKDLSSKMIDEFYSCKRSTELDQALNVNLKLVYFQVEEEEISKLKTLISSHFEKNFFKLMLSRNVGLSLIIKNLCQISKHEQVLLIETYSRDYVSFLNKFLV